MAEEARLVEGSPDDLAGTRVRLLFRELARAVRGGRFSARPHHILVRFPITLDEQGWAEAAQLHAELLEEVLAARDRSLERLELSDSAPIESLAAIMLFERQHSDLSGPPPAPGGSR